MTTRSIGSAARPLTLRFAGRVMPGQGSGAAGSPDIPFAPTVDPSLKDPDNPAKKFRVDFARVEHEFPLSRADLMKITPENVAALSQEEVDQLYGRLTAGPIPDGPYLGDLFFRARREHCARGWRRSSAGSRDASPSGNIELLESSAAPTLEGQGVLPRRAHPAEHDRETSSVLRPLVDDPTYGPEHHHPARRPARPPLPNGRRSGCCFRRSSIAGRACSTARRESVIVDYAYSDEIDGYRKSPDLLAGPRRPPDPRRDPDDPAGLLSRPRLREPDVPAELHALQRGGGRARRPGLRRGEAVAEDCWPGEQRRTTAVR